MTPTGAKIKLRDQGLPFSEFRATGALLSSQAADALRGIQGGNTPTATRIIAEPYNVIEIAIRRLLSHGNFAIQPARNIDDGLNWLALVAVGSESQVFTVRRKHWEAIETLRIRNPFKVGPFDIDREKIKFSALRVVVVCREHDPLTIREKEWRKVRAADFRLASHLSVT